eukprot:GSChrysophyteH1.ASY1.ANO1.1805.1 assembled CDS
MFIARHLIYIFCLPLALLHAVVSQTPQSTIRVLHELYESAGGANWNYTSMEKCGDGTGKVWNFAANEKGEYMVDPCSEESNFIGLTCTEDSKVTGITLACGNLIGTIPDFSTMTQLQFLDLSQNQLTGKIPRFHNLTHLLRLHLYQNQLTGTIPEFSNSTQLQELDLRYNRLTGKIPEFHNLTHLLRVHLYQNQLTGTIPEFSNSTQLQELDLRYNRLTGKIPEFHNLTHLLRVHLYQNQLTGTIPEFSNSTQLQELDLRYNRLTGKIPEFQSLTNLLRLHLYQNQLIGTIPEFSNSTQLQELLLYQNRLTGTIPEFSNLKQLRNLDLSQNQLTGTIPEFSNSTQLQELLLSQNRLIGMVPEFSNSTQLHYLLLYHNQLTGTMPEFSTLAQLQYLLLYQNQLTGTIPEVSNSTQLQYLDLSRNQLTGTIPEFSTLTRLQHLHLYQNQLIGTIPEFSNSTQLQYLDLYENKLTGTIPEFSTLMQLKHFYLSENKLTGTVPEFNTMTQLQQFYLDQNQLTGTIPEFSTMTQLQELLLSQNQLTGTIPEQLSVFTDLKYIALGSNCIEGIFPESLCGLKKLRLLDFTNMGGGKSCRKNTFNDTFLGHYFDGFTTSKYLEGTIPDCIWSLPNLAIFYAGGNRIRGQIPEVLGSQLQNISLPFNNLEGKLPSALVTNPNISTVALQHNRLQGDLSVFSSLSSLNVFNASVNSLSGIMPKHLLGLVNIDILTGNVFDCSWSDRELPLNDPSYEKYQCGSNLYNRSFYTFLVVLIICVAVIWYYSALPRYFRELQFWREVAMGKKWRTVNIRVSLIAVHKYAYQLFQLQWSLLKMSFGLLIVLITYLSLWKSRLIEFSYGWISTAAYITGSSAAIALVCAYFVVIFCITIICDEDEAKDMLLTKKGNDEESNVEKKEEYSLRELAAFALRMICLTSFIWGFLILGNGLYLYVLLNFSIVIQDLFRYCFAIFKWSLVYIVTYRLFDMDALTFGLSHDKHMSLIDKYCGSKLRLIFLLNAVSLLLIPIITQMIVDPACFYNYFRSASIHTFTSKTSLRCSVPYFSLADCNFYGLEVLTTHITYDINADVPFLYNYSCTPAIIRAYVPLYANMYCLILAKCIIQYIYLFNKAKQEIDPSSALTVGVANNGNDPSEAVGWLKYLLLMAFPLNQLMWDSHQRMELSKNNNVFPTSSKSWLWRTLPNNLGNVLIFVTFGTLAPLLGLMIIAALFAEVYITELVMGRFLVREISVIIYSKRNVPMIDGLKYEHVPISTDPRIRRQAEDVDEHWGAIAAVKEVAKLCEEVPLSIFSSSREVILLLTASILSFLLNDLANSSGNPYEHIQWPSVIMITSPFVSIFGLRLYKWKSQDAPEGKGGAEPQQVDGMEMTKIVPTKKKPEETNSPIHL